MNRQRGPVVIDEVQSAPFDLLPVIETAVRKTRFENRIRSYGMFLLKFTAYRKFVRTL